MKLYRVPEVILPVSAPNRASIEYANPSLPKPPTRALYFVAIGGWAIAALGGLTCLIGFAITRDKRLVLVGLAWLPIGGVMTAVATVCGFRYASAARGCNFSPPHTNRRANFARRLPLTNIALAGVCTVLGVTLLRNTPIFVNLSVHNQTGAAIDDVVAAFDDGTTKDFGSLAPGVVAKEKIRLVGSGRVVLRVRQGSEQWDQIAIDFMDEDDFSSIERTVFPIQRPAAVTPTTAP